MKRAWGVIPARLGSSRFPGKPLATFLGKPMIEYTYRAAKESTLLSKVIVATDSDEIASVIRRIGGHAVLTGDCATGTDRVVDALRQVDAHDLEQCDVIVNIQGDEPGVNPKHIDACIEALSNDSGCVMSTLATPILVERDARSRDVVKCVADIHSNALYFSRAMLPYSKTGKFTPGNTSYLRHIGLYAFQKDFLLKFPEMAKSPLEEAEDLEQLRVIYAGYRIKIVSVESALPGVDTTDDLEFLTKQMQQSKE